MLINVRARAHLLSSLRPDTAYDFEGYAINTLWENQHTVNKHLKPKGALNISAVHVNRPITCLQAISAMPGITAAALPVLHITAAKKRS